MFEIVYGEIYKNKEKSVTDRLIKVMQSCGQELKKLGKVKSLSFASTPHLHPLEWQQWEMLE